MTTPRVSVLMPVWNAERYLAEAIESVLVQSEESFELLCFDDGSTDDSARILADFARHDERVRVSSGGHRGYAAWLAEGALIARAELMARMDADDRSRRRRFELQARFLEENPSCVAVGSRVVAIDPDGDPLCGSAHDLDHAAIWKDLLGGGVGVIAHPSVMLRRSALLAVGNYRPEFEPAEDLDLWFRLSEVGELANLAEALLEYRQHPESVCATRSREQVAMASRISNRNRARLGLPAIPFPVADPPRVSLAELHREWGRLARGSGYLETAEKHEQHARGLEGQRESEEYAGGPGDREALQSGVAVSPPGVPRVTVAVCTRNRVELVERCLSALERQETTGFPWETLVVDNGDSDSRLAAVVDDFCRRGRLILRLVLEVQPGLSRARNAAVCAAKGEIIAFLDDDCEPEPRWLFELHAAFGDGVQAANAAGGAVLPKFEKRPGWFKERYELDTWGDLPRWLERGESFSGNNMAFRVDALRRWGPFETSFGLRANALVLGEDTELFRRVWRERPGEARFSFTPAAVVRHWIPAAKTAVRYSLLRAYAEGRATARLDFLDAAQRPDPSRALKIVNRLVCKVFSSFTTLSLRRDLRQWIVEDFRPAVVVLGELRERLGRRQAKSEGECR